MKKIYIYSMLCTAVMLTGCHKGTEYLEPLGLGTEFRENYVKTYVDAASFTPSWASRFNTIGIMFQGEKYSRDRYTSAEFNALAEKYGDTYFNRYRSIYFNTYAMANEFTSVSVVSDNDFNGIPAGAPLNGVIKICASSPLKYIESGYTLLFNWPRDMPEDYKRYYSTYYDQESHPVNKLLSELTPADLVLLDKYWIYLLFTETPSEKEHNFTITFNIGETRIENTVAATFD